jgi:hypothetical protein
MICSPDSSTFVVKSGYDLLTFRRPSSIFGNSDGASGSTATFRIDWFMCLMGLKMYRSSSISFPTIVAVLLMDASTPDRRIKLPAGARSTSTVYLLVSLTPTQLEPNSLP